MFIFLKLILAHLIADFILQFEELYQLKVRNFLGQFFHAVIQGLISLILLYPYLNALQIWFFVAWVVLAHLAQDLIKYKLTQKTPRKTFLYFMADQLCHILVLSTVFLLPISREVRGFPTSALVDILYRTNSWTVDAIFFITLTFAGSYILNAFIKSYLKDRQPLYLISSPEVAHAILERSLIAWILISSVSAAWMLFLLPCVGIFRLPFKTLRDLMAFLLSLSYGVWVTLLFQRIYYALL
ncbi:MAG: DUF3307 domain-containing protein [Candidatus Omnitrophica bacterium]|nr:DUF3307 domain-containing protein [Candidatus Omnitrophota bacterium]